MSKKYIFGNILNMWNYASLGHQNIFYLVTDLGEAFRDPPPPHPF